MFRCSPKHNLREEDGASTVAFLEAPIPAERQHVQLEVDDEPAVPEEPTAAVPFVTWQNVNLFFCVSIWKLMIHCMLLNVIHNIDCMLMLHFIVY